MQGPTHLLTGVLIQKALGKVQPLYLKYALIAFLASTSHGILDKLARFTYHPSMPLTKDWFWISFHLFISFLTIFILIKYWGKYKLGLIFSVFPDFDWLVINFSNLFSFQIPFWKEAILHNFFSNLLNSLFHLSFLSTLPSLTHKKRGAIIEFALIATLFIIIYLTEKEKVKCEVNS